MNAQIFEQKLNRVIVVGFDSADFCGRENYDLRFLFHKKLRHRGIVAKIKLDPIALEQVREARRFERPRQGAPYHAPVTGNKNLV